MNMFTRSAKTLQKSHNIASNFSIMFLAWKWKRLIWVLSNVVPFVFGFTQPVNGALLIPRLFPLQVEKTGSRVNDRKLDEHN